MDPGGKLKLEQMAPLRSLRHLFLSEQASCQPKPERTQKTEGTFEGIGIGSKEEVDRDQSCPLGTGFHFSSAAGR